MRVSFFLPVLFFLFVLSAGFQVATAKPNLCKANGCGPEGALGSLVANNIGDCKLKKACDHHDKCYSRCMKCGDLYGKKQCKKVSCKWYNNPFKKKCDEALEADIIKENKGKCKAFAASYKYAVKLLGCTFYQGRALSIRQKDLFKKNFKALKRMQDYHLQNNIPLDSKIIDDVVDLVAQRPARLENAFSFSVRGKQPVLSIQALTKKRKYKALPRSKAFKGHVIRRYINGIDITNMREHGKPFDLNMTFSGRARRSIDLDMLKNLEQVDRVEKILKK